MLFDVGAARLGPLVLLLVEALLPVGPTTNPDDPLTSSTLGQLVSVETVCATDWRVCPNGERAFRDRNHGCAFTSCDRIASSPAAASAADLTTRDASQWFGREEFAVPVLHVRDLRRGRSLYRQMVTNLDYEAQRCASICHREPRATRCADVYWLDSNDEAYFRSSGSGYDTSINLLRAASSSGSTDKRVVFQGRWTRLAFLGRLVTGAVDSSRMEDILQLVSKEDVGNTTDGALNRTRAELPSLAIASSGSMVVHDHSLDANWTASGLSSAAQRQLLGFLAKQARVSATALVGTRSKRDDGDNSSQLVVFIARPSQLFTGERCTSEWRFLMTPCKEGDPVNGAGGGDISVGSGCGCYHWRLVQERDEEGDRSASDAAKARPQGQIDVFCV